MLYMSAMDHARKLKFCSYAHLPSINIYIRLIDSVQCRRGYYFRAWALYFSFGTYSDFSLFGIFIANFNLLRKLLTQIPADVYQNIY